MPLDNSGARKSAALAAIESKYYCCPRCDFTAVKEQLCPEHQLPLVKVGNYYCMICGKYSSAEQGACPDKHGAKIRMNMKYPIPEKMPEEKSGSAK